MDDRRFDEVSIFLAVDGTRRGMFRLLSGGAVAALLTRFGLAEVGAKPKKTCNKRKKIGQKCKLNNGAKCKCRGGAKCRGGKCKCPKGTDQAGNTCVKPPACLDNGVACSDSNDCCSDFCGDVISGPDPACCVPNDEVCANTSDCCANVTHEAACENDRCCLTDGSICATPNGVQVAECCPGLTCDAGGTNECF